MNPAGTGWPLKVTLPESITTGSFFPPPPHPARVAIATARTASRPAAAVGQAGVHDPAVQALQPPVVAAAGRERAALDAARVDHAAVPVLAELRVAARPDAGVGAVEVRVVPPEVVGVGVAVGPGA